MERRTGVVITLLLVLSQAYAQQSGMPFIRNFPPQEYKASPQNWSIVQDKRGVMYFGNNDGVLEFDGVNWRLIKIPGVSPLAVDNAGRIFVGLDNDIGYIEPDKTGTYQYRSLKPKIPEMHRDINICSRAYVVDEQVIFITDDKIYIYEHDKFNVITSTDGFYWSFVVNNRFFVNQPGEGLLYLHGDSLRLIAGTGLFAKEPVIAMMPYRQNEILIVTQAQGILIYSPGSAQLYKPVGFDETDNFLKKNEPYCGIQLPDGNFALGTISGGVLVFDAKGKIKDVYDKSAGLQDNSIYHLYTDRNQQLWAAMDNGISLIQNNLPFRQFTDKNGLNGATMCLRYFKNHFYVGTGQYVHIQNEQGDFEPLAGTESQNFDLYEAHGSLLLANLDGIFEIQGKQVIPLVNTTHISALSFCSLTEHPDYLVTGATNGIYLLEYKNSSWGLKHRIKGFNKPAYKVDEDKEGNIWVSTFLEVCKLHINSSLDSVISFESYSPKQGLPSSYAMAFTLRSGEVVFCTENGVYQYLSTENRFEPDPRFRMLTGKLILFVQDKNGNIWFEQLLEKGYYEKGVLKFVSDKYIPYTIPFNKFSDIGSGDCPFNICSAPDGSVFFGTNLGLLKYDPSIEANYKQSFNTIIRTVSSKDSVLFGGEKFNPAETKEKQVKEISYAQNHMIFHFAATSFEDAENNLYSYRLIGSDTSWSEWTNDSKKEYTNLHEGRYTFEVKSKNQYQITGSIAFWSFRILPPWYRTLWAFVAYFIALIMFLISGIKLYTRRLGKQKLILEEIVSERTAQVLDNKKEILEKHKVLSQTNIKLNEINTELNQTNEKLRETLDIVSTQKTQIEKAHKQITYQNTELKQYRNHLEQLVEERTKELLQAKNKAEESDRLKTAFLQNMSHEIRTPMNGILGFLSILEEPNLDDASKSNYIDIIKKSGQRLLNTINDIIEISRIEANQVTVYTSEVDVMKVMDFHYDFFKRQAEEKGLILKLSAQIRGEQAIVESDKNILDNILTNLINNAIKFTNKGMVEFGNYLEQDSMIFFVKDTGIGIPADRREAVFDRFVQADLNNTRAHEGSGLGLSIVKGYLEILNGTIWLESKTGKGSTFFFSVPYKPVVNKATDMVENIETNIISKKNLTILVVEDDANSYLFIQNILRDLTAKILNATNGNDAVRLLKENPGISLVLMDIKLPGLNGYDATRQIRQFNNTVPIIAQTAYALAGDKEKAIEAGCNDYIAKPINSKELMLLIQKYAL